MRNEVLHIGSLEGENYLSAGPLSLMLACHGRVPWSTWKIWMLWLVQVWIGNKVTLTPPAILGLAFPGISDGFLQSPHCSTICQKTFRLGEGVPKEFERQGKKTLEILEPVVNYNRPLLSHFCPLPIQQIPPRCCPEYFTSLTLCWKGLTTKEKIQNLCSFIWFLSPYKKAQHLHCVCIRHNVPRGLARGILRCWLPSPCMCLRTGHF